MSDAVIITALICATLITLVLLSYVKEREKK